MLWMIFAILFIAFMGLYPAVVRALARRRSLTRLCREIRRAGGKIRRLRRFPALARNCAKSSEFLVRCGDQQYDIKVWSPWHRDAELWIGADGRIFETQRVGAPLSPRQKQSPRTIRGRRYAVPSVTMRTRVPTQRILLITPSYRRILRREGRGVREIATGELIFDKILCTPASFLSMLETK